MILTILQYGFLNTFYIRFRATAWKLLHNWNFTTTPWIHIITDSPVLFNPYSWIWKWRQQGVTHQIKSIIDWRARRSSPSVKNTLNLSKFFVKRKPSKIYLASCLCFFNEFYLLSWSLNRNTNRLPLLVCFSWSICICRVWLWVYS